jgi:serine/threonine protein phosphatase PrpC
VQELVDAGVIRQSEAERHPERNVITRALGAEESVEPDVWLLPTEGRQVFLICSDGLTKELDDHAIAEVLATGRGHAHGLAGELVDQALARGGRDNVTVVVVEAESGHHGVDEETTRDRAPAPEDTLPRRGEA